jgi:hypothetical protein
MRIILILIIFVTSTFSYGQIKDSVFLTRYLYGQDIEYYNLPLTAVVIVKGAYHKENEYYNLIRDFGRKPKTNLLLIEMDHTRLPKSKRRGEGYYHQLQLTLEIPDKGEKEINVVLGNNGKKLQVKNQFATYNDHSYFWKTDKKGRKSLGRNQSTQTLVSGQLKIERGNDYLITGIIELKSQNPLTRQRIVFEKDKMVDLSFDEFTHLEEEEFRLAEEASDKGTEIFIKVLKEKKRFYDSIFSNEKYPKNHLVATPSGYSQFDYKLNKGYITPNSAPDSKSTAIDVFSNDIFQTTEGKNYLITLNHFNDPDTAGIDDETIYSVIIELPTIAKGTNNLSDANSFAKLGYWHFGTFGHVVESNQFSGQIVVTESSDKLVSGTLNISFKDTDNKDFILTGDFQLPVVKRESFDKLKKKLDKLAPTK